jgi:uncharacterized membrane protein
MFGTDHLSDPVITAGPQSPVDRVIDDYGGVVFLGIAVIVSILIWRRMSGDMALGSYSSERRARFVMFLGLGMLAILFIFGNEIGRSLDYKTDWVLEDGWMHALASALVLLGAWKWLNAREDREQRESPKEGGGNGDDRV